MLEISAPVRVAAVSVVVPCYRSSRTIERAVRSVAVQTLRPAELILVDDASQDGTGAVLEELRNRLGADWIRIVHLPSNVGSASARNAGWEIASQKYVAFLDADDAWHPRKVEIQYAWMEAHPDFVVTGHSALQLTSEAEVPGDPGSGDAHPVSRAALYKSNQFVTPSVMLRRDIPQRFEPGKRYMEDYLLWLEIATSGGQFARLPQVLAYTFKAPFGEAGLSARTWKMEQGELDAFSTLRRKRQLGVGFWLLLSGFSLLKFLRRMLMLATGYSPTSAASKPTLLYAAAYLVLTQAMTALLICAGLFGHSELAADIGIVQAATLATFFAFSGNARNLILTDRASVQREAILAARLALLLPLGAMAVILCAIVTHVDLVLILMLIARRGVEWIGELHLSESELLGNHAVARKSLLLQSGLLLVAVGAIGVRSDYVLWALAAWALLPAFPLLRFTAAGIAVPLAAFRNAMTILLPHYGSTAASGMSLYAFRALLVLVAGRAVAGDLFVAFAIGSFPGSMFANILGPSVSLHEERIGSSYLPKSLWTVTTAYLFCGVALLGLHWSVPAVLEAIGGSPLFWTALGWSLVGGVVMVIAQRVKLQLIAGNDGRMVFGADVLMHIYLIAAVPALYAVDRIEGLAFLYLLNATLALLFYAGGVRGEVAPLGERTMDRIVFATVFLIFLPVFFLVNGKIYNPQQPVVDSGGMLSNLPLPISLLACSGGLLIYGRYFRAAVGLWTIFGLLLLMLVSTAAGGDSGFLDRAKLLLLLQIILPTFGLVLGAVMDPQGRHSHPLQLAIFSVIVLVVPAQLMASWLYGSWTLKHSVFLFGVYQHQQFVPVILACGYLLAFQGLWARWKTLGKVALSVLLVLVAVYAVAAHSVLAMCAVVTGTALFGFAQLRRSRDFGAAIAAVAVFTSFAGYHLVAKETFEYRHKFRFLVPPDEEEEPVGVASYTEGIRPHWLGRWQIVGVPQRAYIMVLAPAEGTPQATLLVEGELFEGKIEFQVRGKFLKPYAPGSYTLKAAISHRGPFRIEIEVDQNRGDGDVWIFQSENGTRGTIRNMRWLRPGQKNLRREVGLSAISVATAAQAVPREVEDPGFAPTLDSMPNVTERFLDWKLFGQGILDSPKTFLFGHPKPLAREQRTSAHNFYIDFAYNFGVLALLPLLSLIGYTATLLWRQRLALLASGTLFALAATVAFLVLVESNLKVSLRQPYPGIAIFFFWGLLLARLRELTEAPTKAD